MSKNEPDGDELTVGCLLVLATLPFLMLANGWTLHLLWGWFLTPTFGISSPGIVGCLGIALLISYMFHNHAREKPDSELSFLSRLVVKITTPIVVAGVTILFGWILHLFM